MKLSSGLNKHIFLALAVVGLFPLLVMAFQNHYFARKVIENVEKEHLAFSLHSRLLWLRTWVNHTRRDFYHLAFNDDDKNDQSGEEIFVLAARKLFKSHVTYRSISLYRSDWSLLIRYPEGFEEEIPSPPDEYREKLQAPGSLFIAGEEYHNAAGEVILPVGQRLTNHDDELGAFLVAEMNLSRSMEGILGDTSDLNDGGKYILTTEEGKILYRSPPSAKETALKRCEGNIVSPDMLASPPWEVQKTVNCDKAAVYSITAPVPEFKWRLIGHFGTGSVLHQFKEYILYGLVTAFCILFVLVILAHNFSKRLATPLDKLTEVARQISAGQHNERLPLFKEAYAQEVGEAFNTMMDTLKKQQQSIIQSTSLSTVGKISSSLVHEMRNPLSSIKINLQALSRKVKDDENYGEMATIALMQTDRLEGMCNDLLKLSKPMEINKKPITFAELVEEVLAAMKPEADEKNIELKVKDQLQDFLFHADKEHSCRALGNLVGNAIQWSDTGGVVTISGIRPDKGKGAAMIRVTDSGPGLRPEQIEKIFQPFFTTRELGTGLGLTNVKKIMDYQGGAVFASNNPDKGASFSLIFKD